MITNRWTRSTLSDVQSMMFESFPCLINSMYSFVQKSLISSTYSLTWQCRKIVNSLLFYWTISIRYTIRVCISSCKSCCFQNLYYLGHKGLLGASLVQACVHLWWELVGGNFYLSVVQSLNYENSSHQLLT